MPDKECSSTKHSATLTEVTTDLSRSKELFDEKVRALQQLFDERDRRYEERFTSMDEKTTLALASSEKAVTKAEAVTEKRFESVNEFRGQLNDQAKNLMSRPEAEVKFQSMETKIDDVKKEIVALREFRSQVGGGSTVAHENREQTNFVIYIVVIGILSAASLLVTVGQMVFHK